jgi:MoaA/NifB/PqqE/SkfB family radical SAM enzyme
MGGLQDLRWRATTALSYRLRDFASGTFARHCRPASIILLVTERCNARCVHCDIWKNKGAEPTPEVATWKKLLSELAGWLGAAQVALSGGEALLRPYTPELLRFGRRCGLRMELLSHGYWLDQSRMEAVAAANPWRITISVDGIGEVHNRVRGRSDFWQHTERSLSTLIRLRDAGDLSYILRLKTVIMRENLEHVHEVAEFAAERGIEVFYQPIEQNYNTPDNPEWYLDGDNWPRNTDVAIRQVDRLIQCRNSGLPIANTLEQLTVMKAYFANPGQLGAAVQAHTAHEAHAVCSAATSFQVQANGDVVVCSHRPPVGNISARPIREIWAARPPTWKEGCCQCRPPEGKSASRLTVLS